jgi:predicted O-methyltransferase YrrM
MGFGIKRRLRLLTEMSLLFKNRFMRPRLYDLKTSERIGVIYHYPSDMCESDRIMLYALVRGLRPKCALEIGARWGGSAKIISNAMEDNQFGQVVSLEPETDAFRVKENDLHDRHTLVRGYSPQDTPVAVDKLDDLVDFAFIDALHIHDAALLDFNGIIPFLAEDAHVLLHDAYHQGINGAIEEVISKDDRFVDCGFISRHPNLKYPVAYQGMRLLRFKPKSSEQQIRQAYTDRQMEPPEISKKYWNYDEFAIRVGIVDSSDCSPGKAKLRE